MSFTSIVLNLQTIQTNPLNDRVNSRYDLIFLASKTLGKSARSLPVTCPTEPEMLGSASEADLWLPKL